MLSKYPHCPCHSSLGNLLIDYSPFIDHTPLLLLCHVVAGFCPIICYSDQCNTHSSIICFLLVIIAHGKTLHSWSSIKISNLLASLSRSLSMDPNSFGLPCLLFVSRHIRRLWLPLPLLLLLPLEHSERQVRSLLCIMNQDPMRFQQFVPNRIRLIELLSRFTTLV
jgi:hypothetical protein